MTVLEALLVSPGLLRLSVFAKMTLAFCFQNGNFSNFVVFEWWLLFNFHVKLTWAWLINLVIVLWLQRWCRLPNTIVLCKAALLFLKVWHLLLLNLILWPFVIWVINFLLLFLELELYLIKIKIEFLFLLVAHLLHDEVELKMNIPLILRRLPPLVTIYKVFVNDAYLLNDPERCATVLVFHISRDGYDLLMELVNLFQLDEKELVPDNTFYQWDKLFSCEDVQGD
jgi:hypothetical protein